ncbi:MAG: PEP-CTERM sorting domain-containing protein [Phycisphaerales bacterium]|nr:PEP-CTERM sorting domain-containing protein [Phycisphaerales bacterium]
MKHTLSAIVVLALAGAAHATLIAADSYLDSGPGSYTAGGLNGQNPSISPGWTAGNAWSVGSANLQADSGTLTNGALDHPTGGKGKYIASSVDFYRAGHHKIDSYTPSDTYYMSFLVNPGGSFLSTGSREHAVVGFSNFFAGKNEFENTGAASEVYGLFTGFTEGAPGEADLIMRARNGAGDLEDTLLVSSVDNRTMHVMFRLDVNVGGGSVDEVTYWINPSDISSEAQATATAEATGMVNTFAMDQNNRIDRAYALTNDWARTFFWDETRLGTTFGDVVPEPATLGFIALGGIAVLRRRR